MNHSKHVWLKTVILFVSAILICACSTLASRNNTGVVVAHSAQVRSSTAVVAADLLEVNRGDTVDILDSIDIPDPSDNNKNAESDEENPEEQETTELWYKVRLSPAISPAPEGWIFGKQVELTVPSDIIYYRTGREFVA